MHIKTLKNYYFINSFDINNLQNQSKETIIIYRNYTSSNINIINLLKLKNFLNKKGNKFFLANNFRLALNLGLDGVYIPSFNQKFDHLALKFPNNFTVVGSAHNLREIRIKELQGVQSIFISSLFKKNKNYLGINKFKILKKCTKKNIVALGGVSKSNIKKIRLINVSSFAGISFFE